MYICLKGVMEMGKQLDDEKLKYIVSSINQIAYGSIVITVHEGDITQIDITEKKRFTTNKKTELKK